MKKKIRLSAAVLLAAISMVFAGCAGSSNEGAPSAEETSGAAAAGDSASEEKKDSEDRDASKVSEAEGYRLIENSYNDLLQSELSVYVHEKSGDFLPSPAAPSRFRSSASAH